MKIANTVENLVQVTAKATTGAALLSMSLALAATPAANAAIFAVGNAGSWASGGANTLSNMGFNMLQVENNPAIPGGYSPLNQIAAPNGTISFSKTVYKAYVGTEWAKLATSNLTSGSPVYFNDSNTLTLSLSEAVLAFDFLVETNSLAPIVFNISVTAAGGITQILQTQGITGNIGGKYFGFYATEGDTINSISISAPSNAQGFAVGELRVAEVPEPATILGSMMALGAIGKAAQLKRKRLQKAAEKIDH